MNRSPITAQNMNGYDFRIANVWMGRDFIPRKYVNMHCLKDPKWPRVDEEEWLQVMTIIIDNYNLHALEILFMFDNSFYLLYFSKIVTFTKCFLWRPFFNSPINHIQHEIIRWFFIANKRIFIYQFKFRLVLINLNISTW